MDTQPGVEERPELTEALEIVADQRERTRRAMHVDTRVLYGAWGLAWLIGYGSLWWAIRRGGTDFPAPWAWVVFATLLAAALVLTLVYGLRAVAGIRGGSRTASLLYDWAWFILFFGGMGGTGFIMGRADIDPLTSLMIYNTVVTLIVGAMYLAGGALLGQTPLYAIGLWTVIIGFAAALVGLPAGFLVMALGGGGGMLIGVVVEHLRLVRGRSRDVPR